MEKQLEKVAIEFKKLLKEMKISSRLPKKPVSSDSKEDTFRFSIGIVKGSYQFRENYLLCTSWSKTYPSDNRYDKYVAQYLKMVAEATGASFLAFSSRYSDKKKVFEEEEILEKTGNFTSILPSNLVYFYSSNKTTLHKYSYIIRALLLFLRIQKRISSAFRFHLEKGDYLWGIKYYHKGFNGLMYLKEEGNQLYLCEDNIEFKQHIKNNNHLFPQFKKLLEETEEYNRLENLLNPNDELFIERFRRERMPVFVAKAVFRHIIEEIEFEEIEEKIATTPLYSFGRSLTPITLKNFMGYYFIYHSYKPDHGVLVFPKKEKEKAFEQYTLLSMEHIKDDIEQSIERYDALVDKKDEKDFVII